jgi:hypothetical protein
MVLKTFFFILVAFLVVSTIFYATWNLVIVRLPIKGISIEHISVENSLTIGLWLICLWGLEVLCTKLLRAINPLDTEE